MLTKKEIVDILKDDSQNKELFELADKVRHDNVGDEIHLRGLIEFSNTCKCTCSRSLHDFSRPEHDKISRQKTFC